MNKIFFIITTLSCISYHLMQAMEKPAAKTKTSTLSKDYCGAGISKSTYVPDSGNEQRQLACLVAGYRNFVLTNDATVRKTFGPDYDAALKQKNITVFNFQIPRWMYNRAVYNTQGERNALLLIKKIMTNSINKIKGANDYLWGLLLGYNFEDREFFYQLDGFALCQREIGYEGELPDRGEFLIWPETFKTEFSDFEKNVWPTSQAHQKYVQDVADAHQWIEDNKKFSAAQLYAQIGELKKALPKQ